MKELVNTFAQSDLNTPKKGNVVVLSKNHYEQITLATEINNEVTGVLIGGEEIINGDTYFTTNYVYVLGVGTAGSCLPEQRKIDVVNRIVKEMNEEGKAYTMIQFHTHTKGTIEKYGEYYTDHFSSGDYNSFEAAERESERGIYNHVLFTPTHILTWGKTKLSVLVTKNKNAIIDDNQLEFHQRFIKELNG